MDNYRDLYNVLNVESDSETEQIKQAYKQLVRLYHPDSGSSSNNEKFFEIQNAWEVLSDNEKRTEYDRNRSKNGWQERAIKSDPAKSNSTEDRISRLDKAELRASSIHSYGLAKPIEEEVRSEDLKKPKSKSNETAFLSKLQLLSKKK